MSAPMPPYDEQGRPFVDWPRDLPNPTWHDHFYNEGHSPLDDEEHHAAVQALLRYSAALREALDALCTAAEAGFMEWGSYQPTDSDIAALRSATTAARAILGENHQEER